jgi:ribosome maturation factor RimP
MGVWVRFRKGPGAEDDWHRSLGLADIAALTAMIEPHAHALGLSVVRVAMFGGTSDPTLQVMAERPDTRQLTLDDCAALSRRLSEMLDALEGTTDDPIDHAYRLEVSSPGIDRPLTRIGDYADWAGHEARIRLSEAIEGRKQFDAVLDGIDGETVQVTAKHGAMAIPFTAIAAAKLILTDKLIKATVPLDATAADRIIEEDVH